MITHKKVAIFLAFFLALFASGCFGTDAKSAFLRGRQNQDSAEKDGDDESIASSSGRDRMRDEPLDAAAYTPEDSMRRDLAKLREHETRQARLVKELQTELSDGRQIIAEEEKRLLEIQDRIARYEDAMGGVNQGFGSGSRMAYARERQNAGRGYGEAFASENENRQFNENDYFANRGAPANLANNPTQNTGYGDSMQEEVLYSSGGPAAGNAAPNRNDFNPNKFAGAPRGRPKTNTHLMNKIKEQEERELEQALAAANEEEVMVWNPNDPSQPVPPSVLASMPDASRQQQRQPETIVSRPQYNDNTVNNLAAAPAAAKRAVHADSTDFDDNPYGNYTADVFSPDLLFGRGS
jgi:hypothetical protein